MMEMRSIPASLMHRHEWLTEVFHSQLLNGLAKKKLFNRCLTTCIPEGSWLAAVLMDLCLLHTTRRSESDVERNRSNLG